MAVPVSVLCGPIANQLELTLKFRGMMLSTRIISKTLRISCSSPKLGPPDSPSSPNPLHLFACNTPARSSSSAMYSGSTKRSLTRADSQAA